MIKYEDLYHYYSAFQSISIEDWHKLESFLDDVSFLKGELLFEHNKPAPNVIAIRAGIVRTFYRSSEGKETTKIFLTQGQIASPYIENVQQILPRASSEALTDISAVSIPFKILMSVLDSSLVLTKLHLRLVQSFYALKEKREYEFLTLDAKQRYEIFLEEFGPYADDIPNMYIASYIGITPVSLSRLRKQIKTMY